MVINKIHESVEKLFSAKFDFLSTFRGNKYSI